MSARVKILTIQLTRATLPFLNSTSIRRRVRWLRRRLRMLWRRYLHQPKLARDQLRRVQCTARTNLVTINSTEQVVLRAATLKTEVKARVCHQMISSLVTQTPKVTQREDLVVIIITAELFNEKRKIILE